MTTGQDADQDDALASDAADDDDRGDAPDDALAGDEAGTEPDATGAVSEAAPAVPAPALSPLQEAVDVDTDEAGNGVGYLGMFSTGVARVVSTSGTVTAESHTDGVTRLVVRGATPDSTVTVTVTRH